MNDYTGVAEPLFRQSGCHPSGEIGTTNPAQRSKIIDYYIYAILTGFPEYATFFISLGSWDFRRKFQLPREIRYFALKDYFNIPPPEYRFSFSGQVVPTDRNGGIQPPGLFKMNKIDIGVVCKCLGLKLKR